MDSHKSRSNDLFGDFYFYFILFFLFFFFDFWVLWLQKPSHFWVEEVRSFFVTVLFALRAWLINQANRWCPHLVPPFFYILRTLGNSQSFFSLLLWCWPNSHSIECPSLAKVCREMHQRHVLTHHSCGREECQSCVPTRHRIVSWLPEFVCIGTRD